MLTITRRLEFDAGHRLVNHESKCRNIHGHRYVALITVRATKLDDVGRVIDFGRVKELVGSWIDEHWDHGYIHESGDMIAGRDLGLDLKFFDLGKPPTVENLSMKLYQVASELLLAEGIEVCHVRLYETPNCYADYNGPPL